MIHSDDLDFILSDQLKEMEVGVTLVVFRDPEIEFNKLNIFFTFQILNPRVLLKTSNSGTFTSQDLLSTVGKILIL
jgi:hypothetical protein